MAEVKSKVKFTDASSTWERWNPCFRNMSPNLIQHQFLVGSGWVSRILDPEMTQKVKDDLTKLDSMSNLCDPMNCSLPGSSVHGIILARILEWIVISSSRGFSWSRDWTHSSCGSCFGGQILYHWPTWEAPVRNDPESQGWLNQVGWYTTPRSHELLVQISLRTNRVSLYFLSC